MLDRFGREHPDLSHWAMTANKALLSLAYFDERRGFLPMGRELMWRCLDAKRDYVKIAEEAQANGEPMTPEEFVDMCSEGFLLLLGGKA